MRDYIKREDAERVVSIFCDEHLKECAAYDGVYPACDSCHLHNVKSMLKEIPAADVRENVRGEWETDSDNLPVCSKCGEIALQRVFVKVPHLIQDVRMVRSNFCPNCGPDMRGQAKEDQT